MWSCPEILQTAKSSNCVFKVLAKKHSGNTRRRFKCTDEIGAVLNSLQDVFKIINLILDEVHPYQIRFSLVRDIIDVGEESDDVASMDSPAFHRAAVVINQLKQNGLLFNIATDETITDMSITNQVSMLLLLRQRWSVKHYKIVTEYRNGKSQQVIANNLNVSQQEVSRLLRQINWKQYRIMEDMIYAQFKLLGNGK
jgi:SatD family (SatD)